MIGVAISTYKRPEIFKETYKQWKKYLPKDAKLVVVSDADESAPKEADYVFTYRAGVSGVKNKCLELLKDCEHIFLSDDDTYPTHEDWWKPYVNHPAPHLQYNFIGAPSHWPLKQTFISDDTVGYDKGRGCFLYVENRVLEVVGGMQHIFGRFGREHEDWSLRIKRAGFIERAFQSPLENYMFCLDETTKGISSLPSEDKQAWKYVDESNRPIYAEYREKKVPVIVARRNDGGHRDHIWRFLKENYWSQFDNIEIIEAYHTEGQFNRSAALNMGAMMAGNWDVALFIDSDAYAYPEDVLDAIRLARESQVLVTPFDQVVELNLTKSWAIMMGNDELFSIEEGDYENIRTTDTGTQSLIVAVPRNLYEQVLGFDEKFVGWGGEDNAFWHSCKILGGEPIRIERDIYHLWHKPADKARRVRNNYRWKGYQIATTRQGIMSARRQP